MRSFNILFIVIVYTFFEAQINTLKAGNSKTITIIEQAEKYLYTNFDSTLLLCDKAYSQAALYSDTASIGLIHKLQGMVYYQKGNYPESLTEFNLALDAFLAVGDSLLAASIYNNIGLLYQSLGDNNKALTMLQSAISIYEQLNIESPQANSLNNIGLIFFRKNDLISAETNFNMALEIANKYNKNMVATDALGNLGALYNKRKQYNKSMAYYKKALELHKANNDNIGQITNLYNIASTYVEIKQYNAAVDYLNQALNLSLLIKAEAETARNLNMFGTLYNKWQRPQIAIDYFYQAIDIAQKNSDQLNLAESLNGIANSFFILEQVNKAIENYNLSAKIFEQTEQYGQLAEVYIQLGVIYSTKFDNYLKAEKYFSDAETLINNIEYKYGLNEVKYYRGINYFKQHNYNKAINNFNYVVNNQNPNYNQIVDAHVFLAQCYQAVNLLCKSNQHYKTALAYKDSVIKNKLEFEQMLWELEKLNTNNVENIFIDNTNLNNNKTNVEKIIIIILIVLLIILMGGVLFFIVKNNNNNKVIQNLRNDIKQLTNQLNNTHEAIIKIKSQSSVSNQIIFRFLANISHEIRTPLNAISGYAKLLARQNKDDINNKYANYIISSSDSLHIVLNNLLDFTKLESGQLRIDKQEFSPLSIVTNVISNNKAKAGQKNIAVEIHIDPFMPESLIGDPIRLIQIFDNLLDNAIKFSPPGKAISFEITTNIRPDNSIALVFKVTNNGPYIPDDKIDKIFSSYSQLDYTPHREGGVGMGLAIVKKLVELQNGKISVTSIPNGTTTFSVQLPFLVGTGNNSATNNNNTKVVNNKTISILLVEDNVLNSELAQDTIKSWGSGFNCTAVENGQLAIDILNSNNKFDIILMDIQMPVMDGHSATNFIRNSMPAPICNIPIIGLTAHAFESEKNEAIKNGMNRYITKPFDPVELRKNIEELIIT